MRRSLVDIRHQESILAPLIRPAEVVVPDPDISSCTVGLLPVQARWISQRGVQNLSALRRPQWASAVRGIQCQPLIDAGRKIANEDVERASARFLFRVGQAGSIG